MTSPWFVTKWSSSSSTCYWNSTITVLRSWSRDVNNTLSWVLNCETCLTNRFDPENPTASHSAVVCVEMSHWPLIHLNKSTCMTHFSTSFICRKCRRLGVHLKTNMALCHTHTQSKTTQTELLFHRQTVHRRLGESGDAYVTNAFGYYTTIMLTRTTHLVRTHTRPHKTSLNARLLQCHQKEVGSSNPAGPWWLNIKVTWVLSSDWIYTWMSDSSWWHARC